MEAIYRDAYPDIFATFEDDFFARDVDPVKVETEDDVDKD